MAKWSFHFVVVAASTVSSPVVASAVTTRRIAGRQLSSSIRLNCNAQKYRLSARSGCFLHRRSFPSSSSLSFSIATRAKENSKCYVSSSSSVPSSTYATSDAVVGRNGSSSKKQQPKVHQYHQQQHGLDDGKLFLDEVEETIENVYQEFLRRFPAADSPLDDGCANSLTAILHQLPPTEREALAVASRLRNRLDAMRRNGGCPRCWLDASHCICSSCRSLEPEDNLATTTSRLPMRRLFLLLHHKEVGLAVDTAKLLLASFPRRARLVVSGIGPQYQSSMAELLQALQKPECLVLFPTDDAQTFADFLDLRKTAHQNDDKEQQQTPHAAVDEPEDGWNVVVIDGTWSQARKMHDRYIPPPDIGGPPRIKLPDDALWSLLGAHGAPTSCTAAKRWNDANFVQKRIRQGQRRFIEPRTDGLQLRRHVVKWREISTSEATRLLLEDMASSLNSSDATASTPWWSSALYRHQEIANQAAKQQLGPLRLGKKQQAKVKQN